jgi:hypothetical protein
MTNHTDSAVTGPIATITQGPRQRSGVALAAAIVGSLLTTGGFFGAIITGLVESDAGVNISTVIFFVGVALALAAIALAVVTRAGRSADCADRRDRDRAAACPAHRGAAPAAGVALGGGLAVPLAELGVVPRVLDE